MKSNTCSLHCKSYSITIIIDTLTKVCLKINKLLVQVYLKSLCWSHPSTGHHGLNNLESTQYEDACISIY